MRHLFAYSGAIFQKDPGSGKRACQPGMTKEAGIFAAECEGSSDFCHVPCFFAELIGHPYRDSHDVTLVV
jgi:hypothetical protein